MSKATQIPQAGENTSYVTNALLDVEHGARKASSHYPKNIQQFESESNSFNWVSHI